MFETLRGVALAALRPHRWWYSVRLHRLRLDYQQELEAVQSRAEAAYLANNLVELEAVIDNAGGVLEPKLERTARVRVLIDSLRANLLVAKREYAPALNHLERCIAEAERMCKHGRSRSATRPRLSYWSTVLAILYSNRAEALSKSGASAAQVAQTYERAINQEPDLLFIWQMYAEHHSTKGEWDRARYLLRKGARSDRRVDSKTLLLSRLAGLACEQADQYIKDGKYDAAATLLREELRQLEAGDHADGWRGRFDYLLGVATEKQGDLAAALQHFEESRRCYERIGDVASAGYLCEAKGDALLRANQDDAATEAYRESLAASAGVSKVPVDAEGAARARTRVGCKLALLLLHRQRFQESARELESAFAGRTDVWNHHSQLIAEVRPFLVRAELLNALKIYLERRLRETREPLAKRTKILDAIRDVHEQADLHLMKPNASSESSEMLSVATPLAVEISLETLDAAGGQGQFLDKMLPEMRRRLEQRYGVRIPGLRLRDNADLPPGHYTILIHELQRAAGAVVPTSRAMMGTAAELKTLGITKLGPPLGDSVEGEAYWIPRAQLEGIAAASSLKPLEVLVNHLERVIEANLIELVGHQEVQNQLENAELISTARENQLLERQAPAHMDPLTTVVRCLVAERVPIVDFKLVHQLFADGMSRALPLGTIVDNVRQHAAVKPQLWGNDQRHEYILLDEELTSRLEQFADGRAYVLPGKDLDMVTSAIARAIVGRARSAVVVPEASKRALVRRIVDMVDPGIPVLALSELTPGSGKRLKRSVVPGGTS
jgi:tetratricopeptide (TPR) repeat protein